MDDVPLTPQQRELVRLNVGLAQKISHDYVGRSTDIELEEVVAIAYQGLVRAAQLFDSTRGVPFGGYARRKINGAILDWQRSVDHVQRSYRRIYKQLQKEGLDAVPLAELARRVDLPIEKVEKVIWAVRSPALSTDKIHVSSNTGGAWDDKAESPDHYGHTAGTHDVEASALTSAIQSTVADTLRNLPPLQQVVIALRYHSGIELQVIAAELGVSLSVIREAHTDAVLEIHAAMLSRVR